MNTSRWIGEVIKNVRNHEYGRNFVFSPPEPPGLVPGLSTPDTVQQAWAGGAPGETLPF